MGLFNRYKFGARVLNMGMRGPDVAQLQEYLRARGYDIPTEETHFGYLTREALQQFQRDFGLVADGKAGKAVYALLKEDKLPITRLIHRVEPGETIEQIAEKYGVGVEAFAANNRIRTLYPGQRLVFFDREVWAIGDQAPGPGQDLTGVLVPFDLCAEDGREVVCPSGPTCLVALCSGSSEQVLWMHNQIFTPLRRKRLAQRIYELSKNTGGVCFCFEQLARVDGGRYLSLIKRVRTLHPRKRILVQIGPGVPRRGLTSGLDYRRLNAVADRIVVQMPQPAAPGPVISRQQVEKLLWPLLREVNSWKILLRIPVYALLWNVTEPETPPEILASSEATSRVYRHNARIRQGDDGTAFYHFAHKGTEYHLRFVHRSTFSQVVGLVNTYNLAGVVIDRLGMEDPRLWDVLRSHFRTAHF
ncbi:MAG: LysM peptidoglycan-binding domain-containing protein [Firmicutes bacterium]|nr:LysM peptidoglycan-binding domain-containing protein [Bacillota bacterium]